MHQLADSGLPIRSDRDLSASPPHFSKTAAAKTVPMPSLSLFRNLQWCQVTPEVTAPVCVRCRLSNPLRSAESTPGAVWHIRHSSRSAPVAVRSVGKTRPVPVVSSTCSANPVHRFVGTGPVERISNRPNSMRVCHVFILWSFKLSLLSRFTFSPPWELSEIHSRTPNRLHLSRAMTSPFLYWIQGFLSSTRLCFSDGLRTSATSQNTTDV